MVYDKETYIHHYIDRCSIHNAYGDEVAYFNNRIYKNMLTAGKIKFAGSNFEMWSDGYFILKK